MSLRIGDTAPDFEIETTQGRIRFHDWANGSWVFFFSHPADFTPVCTTEMGRTAQLAPEFEKRGVKPLGLSTDSVKEHLAWISDVDATQNTTLTFPIVADKDKKVAELYGMIHPGEDDTAAVRTVFLIDPKMKIRLTMAYPMTVGRNFSEILRAIDALQLTDRMSVACPADWKPGDRVIIRPSLSDEEAKRQFPQGFETLRPYLRLTDVGTAD
ncbi:peroxiredoxin [Aurantimonas sp. VKM B-3413]|uniref:peroxiredoxin n=1 Tax=Aurantimonas sp. VKM B-3413 TaxID=2779401 RepID=UPI001E395109|nr:peroxiredoxin [Aurantimonas sp. VKM B-3413]MCB8839916.1 peroxiredoxin [Aurantimonas sp. VKM B-3413]